MSLRAVFSRPEIDLDDRRFVEGTAEQVQQAKAEAEEEICRYQAHQLAMGSQLPEIPRADIEFLRFGQVEINNEFFRVIRGTVIDPRHSSAVAWYVDEHSEIVWLERPPSGPRTRAELEAQQAEREAKRNAPKPRPAWMNQ